MLSTTTSKHAGIFRSWPRGFAVICVSMAGCAGPQSALEPAGRGAESIAGLFWWMVGGAAFIWLVMAGLCIYSIRINPRAHKRRTALLIIGGGVVFPTVVLGILLVFGLSMLPELVEPAPPGSQRIEVTGEQWWWRVRYETPDGAVVELANEIHLPVGEPVEFALKSADVVHAFWIPSLGGKVDMIPGRTNRLRLDPTKVGVYRGVCAEYCGGSHAWMAFDVIVEEREDFERWLEHQKSPAQSPDNGLARHGQQVFLSNGCGACHTIRGTDAVGVIGPDLTHVGSRKSLAAGTLSNRPEEFHKWLVHPASIKPEATMPHFGMLEQQDLEALAVYLDGLD